jgi:hypothetical protein
MINPQKGIDLINNGSIINRILFAVTIFQHSPLTRKVFKNIIRRERERETTSTTSGTLNGISINHQKFFSSNHHPQQGARMASSSSSASKWISITLIHHHQSTKARATRSSQHEDWKITSTIERSWKYLAQSWHHINIGTKLEIFNTRMASHQHQHKDGNLQHKDGITSTAS